MFGAAAGLRPWSRAQFFDFFLGWLCSLACRLFRCDQRRVTSQYSYSATDLFIMLRFGLGISVRTQQHVSGYRVYLDPLSKRRSSV